MFEMYLGDLTKESNKCGCDRKFVRKPIYCMPLPQLLPDFESSGFQTIHNSPSDISLSPGACNPCCGD
jgi:hypothetical protein